MCLVGGKVFVWIIRKDALGSQAEIYDGGTRHVVCAGQTAVDGQSAPQHAGDMRAQMILALDNHQAVLKAADMGLGNFTRLEVYATDVDAALARFEGARAVPPITLLGVARLAMPGLMVEIEATAVA